MGIVHYASKDSYRKKGTRVSAKRKIYFLYNMLTMNSWKNWPLKIKIFDQHAWKWWEKLHQTMEIKIPPWMSLERDILSKTTNITKNQNKNDIESDCLSDSVDDKRYCMLKKIDINSDEMSQTAFRILEKIKNKNENLCMICQNTYDLPELDSENATIAYSQLIICPMENCLHAFHLLCLARWKQSPETENDVLINYYNCPSCEKVIIWGDCIRLQCCILRKINANLEDPKL